MLTKTVQRFYTESSGEGDPASAPFGSVTSPD